MWRPPQRIRYTAGQGEPPTAAQACASRLFSPIEAGRLKLRQRTWVPAMVPWRATGDGFVTKDVLSWYRRFAEGRPGALVVEATGIRDVPSGPLLRIGHERFLPGLTDLVETVKQASGGETRLFIQIIDFLSIRKRPERQKFFAQFLKISDRHRNLLNMPEASDSGMRAALAALSESALDQALEPDELEALRFGQRERVTDTHHQHIRSLPETMPPLFAGAARRAEQAGFDGVELHFAHAYTMASFLSATNTRDDGFGGPRENRVRLPLQVFNAVRAGAGPSFAVGCRLLAEECIPGGSGADDAAFFCEAFARAGMDFISTSRGGKFDDAKQPGVGQAVYPYTGPSGYECMPQFISDERGPFGRNAEPTALIRARVREAGFDTPVICSGGIHNFAMAEKLLADGVCDIAGAARQSLADPDWFLKLSLGRGLEIRTCEYTNYCEALDQKHKTVTCQLWDRERLDEAGGGGLTADGKRRLTAPDWQR